MSGSLLPATTLRVRRHRERRRKRARLFTIELPGHFIDAAIARALLEAEQGADAGAAIQACYAAQLSDKALDWLVRNEVGRRASAAMRRLSCRLHRGRERLVSQRTGIINQIRASLILARGLARAEGLRHVVVAASKPRLVLVTAQSSRPGGRGG